MVHRGIVGSGFGMASGLSVGQPHNPYPDSTLRAQVEQMKQRGIALDQLVPGWKLGTINVMLDHELVLGRPDITIEQLDWTRSYVAPAARIAPETFSFVHCRLGFAGRDYAGLVYYPHPETKPSVNAHRYDVIEIIAPPVPDLQPGLAVTVTCRADAFLRRA